MKKFSIVITKLENKEPDVMNSVKNIDYSKNKYEILFLPGKGSPSIYRNKGAKKAKGEIIVFIDDDAIVPENLLKNAEEFFKEHHEIDIVGGPQLSPKDEKGFARVSGYALSSKFGSWNASNRYGGRKLNLHANEDYLTTAIMFCKKDVFKKIEFDEKIFPGEDSKFVMDAEKEKLKIAFSPKLFVYHKRRKNLKGFMKQIFNYGKLLSSRKSFSDLIKKPFFIIPSLFLIYLLELLFISSVNLLFNRNINWMLFLPLNLYLLMNIIFSFYESIKNRNIFSFVFLPFIFLLLHLSYGFGVIIGYAGRFFKN